MLFFQADDKLLSGDGLMINVLTVLQQHSMKVRLDKVCQFEITLFSSSSYDVNSFEILAGTPLPSMSREPEYQKLALLSATNDTVLYVHLMHPTRVESAYPGYNA